MRIKNVIIIIIIKVIQHTWHDCALHHPFTPAQRVDTGSPSSLSKLFGIKSEQCYLSSDTKLFLTL